MKKKIIKIKAYAKINLSLDVLERMENGYHRIETVMQQIDLFDNITIESLGRAGIYAGFDLKFETDNRNLPAKEDNLAYRAAKMMATTFAPFKDNKIRIILEKRIPLAAGLAGGSSDAAAVMLGLCRLWDINISLRDLCAVGAKLGADVPFCLIGNAMNNPDLGFSEDELASSAALAEGIGEILTPVPSLGGFVIIARPDIPVSTGFVYDQLKVQGVLEQSSKAIRPNNQSLIEGLYNENTTQIAKNMVNVLEIISLTEYPMIVYTKNKINECCKPVKALMSGSGPTVFGYFAKERDAKEAYSILRDILLGESGYRFDLHLVRLLK